MFAENRGSECDHMAGTYTPERPSDTQLVSWIREHIDYPALGIIECKDYIGHDYIDMQWKDRRYFWTAMEALLMHGIAVMPQCRLAGKWFDAIDLIRPWSPVTAEESLVRKMRRARAESDAHALPGRPSSWIIEAQRGSFPLWQPNAWHTPAGRAWVAELRRAAHKAEEPSSSDEEADVEQLDDVPAPPPMIIVAPVPSPGEPAVVCVVCLDKQADTLVLPCQHQVCCRACSDKLKTTADAYLCIVCRQPITEVLADVV
jgi:hypothetical protein